MKWPGLKAPVVGLSLPWIILFVIVFGLGRFVPVASKVRTVLTTVYFEAVRDYSSAAKVMARGSMPRGSGMEMWERDVYRSAGMSMMLSGRFSEAADWFGQLVDYRDGFTGQHQKDYFAKIYRGICFHKLGYSDLARLDWQNAAEAFPDRHDAFVVMGHDRLLEGDIAGAYSFYIMALERAGQLGPIYADIGDAWRYIGQIEMARNVYYRGLQVDPADVFCRLRTGELSLELDNDTFYAKQAVNIIRRTMPTLGVVDTLERAANNWMPGKQLPHIPAARFEPGPAYTWKVAPTRLYFEFFREDWHGW